MRYNETVTDYKGCHIIHNEHPYNRNLTTTTVDVNGETWYCDGVEDAKKCIDEETK